jgi:Protein of unknown function (DUF2946)
MFRRLISNQPKLMLALIALTLAVRIIIPTGFMPTAYADGMMRISLCSGMGPQTAWLDKSGHIHKDAPGKGQHDPQPCGFGALAFGAETPDAPAMVSLPPLDRAAIGLPRSTVAIGRGLAAPPPPSTGPPSLI